MAVDQTCIPTIREQAVRLRQAAVLRAMEKDVLVREAVGPSAEATAGEKREPHRHWPTRLVHAH